MNLSLTDITDRLKETEQAVSTHETQIASFEIRYTELASECKRLREKTTDLESRSRRNNIRIVGFPEKTEESRPTEFITELLPALLGKDHFTEPRKIDRAHRTLQKPNNDRPRAIVACIHHYQIKERILSLARQLTLEYNGKRVHIFPDPAEDILRLRHRFDNVKAKCKSKGVRYGFRHPATFIVTAKEGGETKTFETPEAAEDYPGYYCGELVCCNDVAIRHECGILPPLEECIDWDTLCKRNEDFLKDL